MTEKEELVEKIMKCSVSYGLHRDALDEGKWSKDRLMFTELSIIKDFYRDILTFERNKQQLNGE